MTTHPENDPSLHIDFPDFLEKQFETKKQSIRSAIIFGITIPLLTLIAAGTLALLSHALGGPICTAGQANWICSRLFEILFPAITCTIAFAGVIICACTTWYKFRNYQHWAPWLACLWGLIPFSLGWATGAIYVAL